MAKYIESAINPTDATAFIEYAPDIFEPTPVDQNLLSPITPVQPFTGDREVYHALFWFRKNGHYKERSKIERLELARELMANPRAFGARHGIKGCANWLPDYVREDGATPRRKLRRASPRQRAENGGANRLLTRDEFANSSVQDTFVQRLPLKVLCGNHHALDKKRRRRFVAATKRFIAVNDATEIRWIAIDMDRPKGHVSPWSVRTWWRECGVTEPHVIVINPETGNGKYLYTLAAPVTTLKNNGRPRVVAYLEAVKRGLTERLKADKAYRGGTVRNPLFEGHEAVWSDAKAYTLADIAEGLTVEEMALPRTGTAVPTAFSEGRNSAIFDSTRFFAYANVERFKSDGGTEAMWTEKLIVLAHATNEDFSLPLATKEVETISRKVALKTFRHRKSSKRKPENQVKAAKAKSLKRRAVVALAKAEIGTASPRHVRVKALSEALKISSSQAKKLTSKPRKEYEKNSLSQLKPWVAEGVSRRTWYRRQKQRGTSAPSANPDRYPTVCRVKPEQREVRFSLSSGCPAQ
jgi:hypothetical protein